MSAAQKSEYSALPKVGAPAPESTPHVALPPVVMAGPDDAPATETAHELVDRAEIVNGTTLVKLSKSEQIAADLEAAAKATTFSMATTKDAEAARKFRARCVSERTGVAKMALAMRRPLDDFKKQVIAAERAIVARIVAVEEPVDLLIQADEKRRAEEKAAAEKLAKERNDHTDAALKDIVDCVPSCVDQAATFIKEVLDWLDETPVEEAEYFDRTLEVREALAKTRASVFAMHAAAVAREDAAAEVVRQAAELAEREAALAKREAVGKRIDEIYALSDIHVESDSIALRAALDSIATLDPDFFGPRLREAQRAVAAVTPELNELLAAAIEDEAAQVDAAKAAVIEEPAAAEPVAVQPPAPAPAPAERVQHGFRYVATGAPARVPVAAPAPTPAPAAAVAPPASVAAARPTDQALIGALALHYRADEIEVIRWLREVDLDAAEKHYVALIDACPF